VAQHNFRSLVLLTRFAAERHGVPRVDSLVVTDTFSVRSLVRPIGDPGLPAPFFSLWQQTTRRFAGDPTGTPVPNRFFLSPTLGRTIGGPVLEDVLFLRDEMANLAWGIERTVEGAVEMPVALTAGSSTSGSAAVVPTLGTETFPHYVLASHVADNWIPLLPVQVTDPRSGAVLSWPKRGRILHPGGQPTAHAAQSEVLKALRDGLLYDEEVPREGARITRRRRMTRWTDGSSWVWSGLRNEVGRGEGSAGLQFDRFRTPDAAAARLADAPPTVAAPALGQTSLTTEGAAGTFTTTVANPGRAYPNVTLRGWLTQGTTRRAIGAETLVDCRTGSGAGVLPNGRFPISGAIAASSRAEGVGTLLPGPATFQLQLKQGATVLAAGTVPVALASNVPPSIAVLTAAPAFAFIGGAVTAYAATLTNPGASRSNMGLQGWVSQGLVRRAAGGSVVPAGAGAGVLPTGTFPLSGPISASNTAGGSGTLVPGAATFELQLMDNGTAIGTRTLPVTLQPNTAGIAALSSNAVSIGIGASAPYAATLTNPGASRLNLVLQGWLTQGAVRHPAGGAMVLAGAAMGVLPTGFFNVTGFISVSNTTGAPGVLVAGPATFELQLTANGALVEARTIPVMLTP
jgi:hypothetical protein